MTTIAPPSGRRRAAHLLIAVVSLACSTALSAQTVFLNFSGGGGTPLTIAWTTPITYTITSTPNPDTVQPYFVFNEVGSLSTGTPSSLEQAVVASGAPSYSGNADSTFTINSISWGESSHGSINSLNDVKFRTTPSAGTNSLDIGDVFTLTSGSLTTIGNYTGPLPTDGYYSTFIMDASYTFLGAGSAIPEPSTYATIAGAAMLGLALWHRRRRQVMTAAPAAVVTT